MPDYRRRFYPEPEVSAALSFSLALPRTTPAHEHSPVELSRWLSRHQPPQWPPGSSLGGAIVDGAGGDANRFDELWPAATVYHVAIISLLSANRGTMKWFSLSYMSRRCTSNVRH